MPPLSQLTTGASSAIRTCLQHFVYVPPHRVIPTDGAATPTLIPQPDGSHLPEVLFTLRNHKEPKFLELQDVMQSMFPEIGEILTVARQPNQIAVTVEDRFAKIQVPLKGCGTGVQQILHWVALVLFSNSGRIFLMDEPHVYLHAQAERAFANFLRAHPEHHYVIATHSPMLIDALQPERINLVSRDEQGTAVRPIYHEMSDQHRMLAALGWRPSQFAWAERVLFVEGPTEVGVFEAWFRLWGWIDTTRCAVVDIEGFGTSRPLRKVVDQLETLLAVPMLVYLDGDQKSKESSTHVEFLPELEIENVLVRDRKAVFTVLLNENLNLSELERKTLASEWTDEKMEQFLEERKHLKGFKQLTDMAHEWGTFYLKKVHGPLIAQQMDRTLIEDIREALQPFVMGRMSVSHGANIEELAEEE